jgi:hypothetical protein
LEFGAAIHSIFFRISALKQICIEPMWMESIRLSAWGAELRSRTNKGEKPMRRFIAWLAVLFIAVGTMVADDEREEDRVKDAGGVLKEILNIPEDIPQDLLDKAECVIILPSVKKGAFGIGGSYGRGIMVCRGGEHYTGKWGAPALYALEGVSIGFQLGGQATDFVLLVMNPKGRRVAALQQGEARRRCVCGCRAERAYG